jgi:integrase/recombinase XerD
VRPFGHADQLELIRFLQIAQTVSVHHGALAYLLGINALRASKAAAVRIEGYAVAQIAARL